MSKKTVLVTGASRGIGKAIAVKFAKKGYRVVINCVNPSHEDMLAQVKKEIERSKKFDYQIVNDRLEDAISRLEDVVNGEIKNA